MKVLHDDLQCCVDCAMYLANGGISEERPTIAEDIKEQWPNNALDLVLNNSDEYNEFSSRPCDCCGDRLAGARYTFSVLQQEVKK